MFYTTRKLLLVAFLLMPVWVPAQTGFHLRNLTNIDALRRWALSQPKDEENIVDKDKPEEDDDYFAQRLLWFWQSHTDAQGNFVTAAKNWQEYKKLHRTASKGTSDTEAWEFYGPVTTPSGYNGIGRVNTIAFHPFDPATFWVGSGGGGAWKTNDNGLNWQPMNDHIPSLGVSEIIINPINPNTVYIATGDKEASSTLSIGVIKSTDGGTSWDTTGLTWQAQEYNLITGLVMKPDDTSYLIAATTTGLFRSNDAGDTWVQLMTGYFRQLAFAPGSNSILYATAYDTNYNTFFYRSLDTGITWTQETFMPDVSRCVFAVTPGAPDMVGLITANPESGFDGYYVSHDYGDSFTVVIRDTTCMANYIGGNVDDATGCGGYAWYSMTLAIHPADSNSLFIGGLNTYHSNDGGSNWSIVDQWYSSLPGVATVHADKHLLKYQPGTNILFECNDGGVYNTLDDDGLLWNDLSNGLGITQFYRMSMSGLSSDIIMAGAQDNGTLTGPLVADPILGGDGMDNAVDPYGDYVVYGSSQYGHFNRIELFPVYYDDITSYIPGNVSGEWISPIAINPADPTLIYLGYHRLFRSYNQGFDWDSSTTDLRNHYTYYNSDLTRISVSVQQPDHICVVSGIDTVWRSVDGGINFTKLDVPKFNAISDILIDPLDNDKIWITYSGYDTFKVARYDVIAGAWELYDDLPNLPVNCIKIDTSDHIVYIGTDIGVFYMDTIGTAWKFYSNQLPAVQVTDLDIDYSLKQLWASTYGRGLWHVATKGNGSVGIMDIAGNHDPLKIYPNPGNGNFTIETNAVPGVAQTIIVCSMDGHIVFTTVQGPDLSGKIHLDISALPAGNYAVLLNDKGIRNEGLITILK